MVSKDLERIHIEAQVSIADSLKGIKENLKVLNDNNILHSANSESQHKTIISTLKMMTDKYWWLILLLIAAVLLMAGYKQVASLFIPI